jgi:predicted nucleotidyltransferase
MVNLLSCHADVRAILERLLSDVQAVLGKRLVGLYVHGSLAYGDFNPQTSDIDFLIVTTDSLPAEIFFSLKELHAHLFTSGLPWSQKLEGAYLPHEHLRRHDPAHGPIPWLGTDGHFAWEKLGSDWIIQRWVLREKGIVVTGPPLKPMIDPVSADDLREAVRGSLREWWSPPFPSPERFQSNEYQVYAVLTMCRSLYVLEHGAIASKPEAACWAMKTLDEPWVRLVGEALAWQNGKSFDKLKETFEFIDFTLCRYSWN